MSHDLKGIRRFIAAMPWAIQPEKLEALIDVIAFRAEGVRLSRDEIEARVGDGMRGAPKGAVNGAVAVIPVFGVISHRMNMMTEMSGGTSTELLAKQIDAAAANPDIGAIVLDIDSPGGSVPGVPELAAKIYAARKQKRVVAVANSLAASAAYWLASQADEVVVIPSGSVGSIGVYMVHEDITGAAEKAGVKFTVIKSGDHKMETGPFAPLAEDTRDHLQAECDAIYRDFVGAVARGRGVDRATVLSEFGQGRVFSAKQALGIGLVDRVATMEQVLGDLTGGGKISGSRNAMRAEAMAAMSVEDAAALAAMASANPADATAPRYAVGDRVVATADHMRGMSSMAGAVNEAHAGAPPYYAIDFDEPMTGAPNPHKWLTEDELAPEPPSGADAGHDAAMRGAHDHSLASASNTATVGAVARASLTPVPAPQGRSVPVSDMNTATPSGAAISEAIAAERARATEIRALGEDFGVAKDKIEALVYSGASVAEAASAIRAARQAPTPRLEMGEARETKRPFASFGDFAASVASFCTPGGKVDPRLQPLAAVSGMSQGVPSEGGFTVLPEYSAKIWDGLNEQPHSLLGMTDNYTVSGESITFNANAETSRVDGSRYGAVRGYWIAEGDQLAGTKVKFRQVKLEPQQMAVLVPVTDKLLRNSASALDQYITRAATDEIEFMVSKSIVRGSGAGQPLGLLSSGSLVTVAKETGQAAATINQKNISKMWARLHPRARRTAVWLHNVDIEPQLDELSTTVMNVASTENVGGYANKVFDAERRTLKGRPLIACEHSSTLGTVGDLVLVDLSSYASATRGGIESAMSIHLRFDYLESVFRFVFEVDGQPWLNSALTPAQGSNTLSTHIALATRS